MTFCYQNQCKAVCYSPCKHGAMSSCYQNQCENVCYSPCKYETVSSYWSYDCGRPRSYQSCASLCSSWDCCPSYSYCYPYTSRYTRRYSCYPGYPG